MKKKSLFKQQLITEIKETNYPIRLIPILIERKLVSEKPGPGLLIVWNDEKLNQMSDKELLELSMGLTFESSNNQQPLGKEGFDQQKIIFEGAQYFK